MFDFTPEEKIYFDQLCLAVQDAQANPDHWNQGRWHCGTSHCIGGFGDMRRAGLAPTDLYPDTDGSPFADEYPYWGFRAEIFSSKNSMATIVACLKHIETKGFEYDRSGHNANGFDRDGFSREGWGRDGYNRQGFNRYGQPRPE